MIPQQHIEHCHERAMDHINDILITLQDDTIAEMKEGLAAKDRRIAELEASRKKAQDQRDQATVELMMLESASRFQPAGSIPDTTDNRHRQLLVREEWGLDIDHVVWFWSEIRECWTWGEKPSLDDAEMADLCAEHRWLWCDDLIDGDEPAKEGEG